MHCYPLEIYLHHKCTYDSLKCCLQSFCNRATFDMFFFNGCVFLLDLCVRSIHIIVLWSLKSSHANLHPLLFSSVPSLCAEALSVYEVESDGASSWPAVCHKAAMSHKYHYTNKHSKHNCPNMVKLTTAQILESAPCICFASVGKYFWLLHL